MSRADVIFEASNADEALYLGLLKFKGACGQPSVLLVEGNDDVTFIDACLCRFNPEARSRVATYNCSGKGNVLKLHDLIAESMEISLDEFWCFIDKDFDGMRGRAPSARIWMTPTYSFENLLVSEAVLCALLSGEFRCNDADGAQDVMKIRTHFGAFLASYLTALRFPNLCAFHARLAGIETHSHDSTITPAISVDFPNVRIALSDEVILFRMGRRAPLERIQVMSSEMLFDDLDPVTEWRGKFLLAAFVVFLVVLKHDRGRKKPTIFSKKARMTFDPQTDSVRTFSSLAALPDSLKLYLESIPA
jgi:Protein of unknown function (DUF4435)